MSKIFKKLQLQQTDKSLEPWRSAKLSLLPKRGWIRTLRTSLGMPLKVLGERLGITSAGVSKLEKSEASGTITLNSLRKIADALDCELEYALIPKTSLKEMREQQATKQAQEQIGAVSHSMMLAGQEVDQASHQLIFEELVKELLDGNDKRLWKNV